MRFEAQYCVIWNINFYIALKEILCVFSIHKKKAYIYRKFEGYKIKMKESEEKKKCLAAINFVCEIFVAFLSFFYNFCVLNLLSLLARYIHDIFMVNSDFHVLLKCLLYLIYLSNENIIIGRVYCQNCEILSITVAPSTFF